MGHVEAGKGEEMTTRREFRTLTRPGQPDYKLTQLGWALAYTTPAAHVPIYTISSMATRKHPNTRQLCQMAWTDKPVVQVGQNERQYDSQDCRQITVETVARILETYRGVDLNVPENIILAASALVDGEPVADEPATTIEEYGLVGTR